MFLFRFVFREYKRDQSLYSLSYFPVDIEFMGSSNVIVNCQNSLSIDDDDENKKSCLCLQIASLVASLFVLRSF